jgi:hypothetical protein
VSVSDAAKDEYEVAIDVTIDVASAVTAASIDAVAIALAFEVCHKHSERGRRREFQTSAQ